MKKYDLTAEQSDALLFFDTHDGVVIGDLKDYLGISHQAARNIVERMKKKELLYLKVSPYDGRARLVCLTSKGSEICKDLKSTGTKVGRKLLKGISKEDCKLLMNMLENIYKNMS